jgi:hypothetical protein
MHTASPQLKLQHLPEEEVIHRLVKFHRQKVKHRDNGIEPTASPQSLTHSSLSTGHLKSIEHCRHPYTKDTTDDDKRQVYADKRLQKTIFVMSSTDPT